MNSFSQTSCVKNLDNSCSRKRQYQLNLEINRAEKRRQYQENLKENRAKKMQRYKKNLDKTQVKRVEKYKQNLEKNREKQLQWYQQNVESNRLKKICRYERDLENNRIKKRCRYKKTEVRQREQKRIRYFINFQYERKGQARLPSERKWLYNKRYYPERSSKFMTGNQNHDVSKKIIKKYVQFRLRNSIKLRGSSEKFI